MTTPLSGTSATSTTAVPAAKKDAGLGQDAFMKLLIAQLKYQNPMAPADGQAYMTQMATFTQVEKLGQLVTAQTEAAYWQQRLSADGLVGKTVTGTPPAADGTAGSEAVTGLVTGVRFEPDGPVLELSDGRALALEHVSRASTPTSSTPTSSTTTGTTPS